jgi:hypothetical protein
MAYNNFLSPDVKTAEFDLTGIVPSVSTTEAGLAGQFAWGPVNKLTLVDNEGTLASTFWTPDNTTAIDWFTASNFLSYANKLWVVRVVNETSANTSLRATNATAANSNGFLVRNDDEYFEQFADGSLKTTFGTGDWIAKFPGELGSSLKVSVCPSANAYTSSLSGAVTVSANSRTVIGTATSFTTQVTVGDLIVISDEVHKVTAISNTTTLTLDTPHVAGASVASASRRWEYYNEVDLAPGTSNNARALGGNSDELHVVVVDEDGLFTGQKGTVLEVFQYLSKASDGKDEAGLSAYIKDKINSGSQYIRWAGHSTLISNIGHKIAGTNFGAYAKPINASLVGGKNGADVGNSEKIRGYSFFQAVEDVDVSLILGAGATQTLATYIINNITEVRQDCVAFFSPPRQYVVSNAGDEVTDTVNYRNTLPSSSYAALDNNWKYQYDRYNDVYRYIPLNGDTAGLCAKIDNERDAWWPPAGLENGKVKNVLKLAYNPKLAQRDILYKNGVNPVMTKPLDGTVVFGQKTLLAKPSAFDRINVRRLFIVLRKAISRAAEYFLFRFNDEITRAQFRNMVEPYLRDVQGRRGIYAFKVICDETNNTPNIIDNNQFVGDIYVQPARSIEGIRLNFIASPTGVDFSTIIGKY